MAAVGYEYINVDGGWWNAVDGTIIRNATGHMTYDPVKFPKGIKRVVDWPLRRGRD